MGSLAVTQSTIAAGYEVLLGAELWSACSARWMNFWFFFSYCQAWDPVSTRCFPRRFRNFWQNCARIYWCSKNHHLFLFKFWLNSAIASRRNCLINHTFCIVVVWKQIDVRKCSRAGAVVFRPTKLILNLCYWLAVDSSIWFESFGFTCFDDFHFC